MNETRYRKRPNRKRHCLKLRTQPEGTASQKFGCWPPLCWVAMQLPDKADVFARLMPSTVGYTSARFTQVGDMKTAGRRGRLVNGSVLDVDGWHRCVVQDVAAGITVGVLLIPQSMSYAILAGLPPIYGMYACTVPLFVYAAFASSTQLQIGTVATTSILLQSAVSSFNPTDPDDFIRIAIALSFVVGCVQVSVVAGGEGVKTQEAGSEVVLAALVVCMSAVSVLVSVLVRVLAHSMHTNCMCTCVCMCVSLRALTAPATGLWGRCLWDLPALASWPLCCHGPS